MSSPWGHHGHGHHRGSGRERVDAIAEDRRRYAADAFSMLTDGEKEQLSVILDKIAAGLDQQTQSVVDTAAE